VDSSDAHLIVVPAPLTPIQRLTMLGVDPFEPPPLEYVGSNRFDDPHSEFRVVYCASEPAGAFGETMARLRRSIALLELVAEVNDDEALEVALEGLVDRSDVRRGVVPTDWRFKRQLGVTLSNHHSSSSTSLPPNASVTCELR
jgi:hypothetical protein